MLSGKTWEKVLIRRVLQTNIFVLNLKVPFDVSLCLVTCGGPFGLSLFLFSLLLAFFYVDCLVVLFCLGVVSFHFCY